MRLSLGAAHSVAHIVCSSGGSTCVGTARTCATTRRCTCPSRARRSAARRGVRGRAGLSSWTRLRRTAAAVVPRRGRPCLALVGCVRGTVRPGRLARRRLAPSVSDGARKLAQRRHRMRLHPEGQECHGQTREDRSKRAVCRKIHARDRILTGAGLGAVCPLRHHKSLPPGQGSVPAHLSL